MITPTRGYVLIEPINDTESASGLIIPDSAKEKPQKGIVAKRGDITAEQMIATNKTSVSDYVNYEIGDKVIYKRWGGDEVKDDGKDYVIVKFEDVLGVVS